MACYHPLDAYQVLNPPPGAKSIFFKCPSRICKFIQLPCGQCIGCRLERSRQWAVRCYHEASLYDDNSFVTLTYNDENLPNDPDQGQPLTGTLVRRDLTLFLKRLRKEFGPGIRYYACGEYGDKLSRPHYHLCLFNFDPPDKRQFGNRKPPVYTSKILDKIWGKGYTITGSVTFQSAAYVARYIMKKINGQEAENHYETSHPETGEILNKLPEFPAMSRMPGIGKGWLEKYQSDVYDHDFVVINGKKARPPKYYDRIFELQNPDEYQILREKRVENAKQHDANNTPERLQTRELIQNLKLQKLKRDYEE